MMLSVKQRKRLIEAALGKWPLDLLIQNVLVVNVHLGTIERGEIGILGGAIVSTQARGFSAKRVLDGRGRYALPGFIDSHVHLDTTLLTPENLSELIVPHGTTAMLSDPMESANVGGFKGLQALLSAKSSLNYHLFLEVSSRVPTAPGLETTGGELSLQDIRKVLAWNSCISLGELDPSKVLGLQEEYLARVQSAHRRGKIANGHAAGLSGRMLEAYACGGLADDHEAVDYEEAAERLRVGMSVLVREGSTERNLVPIIRGMLENGLDHRHLMFCTDDKHPDDILEEGHIDCMVNHAIEMGVPPVKAIQMATLNSAEHFHIEHLIGSLAPGRSADLILTENLNPIIPSHVFFRGKLVAEDGKLIVPIQPVEYPEWFYHTVKVSRGEEAADFSLAANGSSARLRVIELYPDQIINNHGQAVLPVINGCVQTDPEQDVLKLAVVERYGKNGNIGITFVRGFGLKSGALASSVAHDHHNIIVAGVTDEDMAACVRAVSENQGGLAVASGGKALYCLPLPLGGLMSPQPAAEVIAQLKKLTDITHDLGGRLPAPFMTVSFISLPTVPELGLTDKGLVDVRAGQLVSPFLD